MLLLLVACAAEGEGPPKDSGSPAAEDADPTVAVPQYQFSYALLADPHVTGPGENEARLRSAVDWVAGAAGDRNIELSFILGDIAWGEGFDEALAALAGLPMPWVPVLGDNPIQAGDEAAWHEAFDAHYDELAEQLPGWSRAPAPVADPVNGGEAWLQNTAFDHRGLRFLAVDWNTRVIAELLGEMPDLHDFEGGTLPFVEAELAGLSPGLDERVVFLSHMPMMNVIGGFDAEEQAVLEGVLGPHAGLVHGNHAGHLHGNSEGEWEACGLQLDITDATWDDEVSVRVVDVWSDGLRHSFTSEVVVVE